jgi:Zn-dependent alcohol dehydrogenase
MEVSMKAAVIREVGRLVIEDIDVPEPGFGEVQIKLVATGVCHTDLSFLQGKLPGPMPFVPGHEGAGVVTKVGPGVETHSVGDHVVCSIVLSCGGCFQCRRGAPAICEVGTQVALSGTMMDSTQRLSQGDAVINSLFAQSSFAEYSVVPASSAVKVRQDAPLDVIAVLGCGGSTGIGAVTRRAKVPVGSSVVVIGAGGVGLSVVMGARAAGATPIIAVDVLDDKLAMAGELGATHLLNATEQDVVARVREITQRGADFAFDAVGTADTLKQAFDATRAGGDVTAIGITEVTNVVTVDIFSLLQQKRLSGTWAGSISPHVDIPEMVDLFMEGRLPLDRLVGAQYGLDELGSAFEAMEAGKFGRAVVCF